MQAEQLYWQVIQLDPRHVDAHHNLGVAAYQAGRCDQAAQLIRRALELDPTNPGCHSNLGLVSEALGHVHEAATCYSNALRLRPGFAEAHHNLGNALIRLGQLDSAAVHFQQAIQLKPTYPEAHSGLANVRAAQGHKLEAVAHFRQALLLNPLMADAHNNLASALQDLGQQSDAVAHWQEALHIRPQFPEASYNLGKALLAQGRPGEAVRYLQYALQYLQDFPEGHSNLGLALLNTGKVEEAIECFHQALRLDPKSAHAYNNLGIALERQDKLEEGLRCYQQAVALQPDLAEAYSNVGCGLVRQGQVEQGLAKFQQALKLKPNLPSAHSNIVSCLNYDAYADPDAVFAAHRNWGRLYESAVPPLPHPNDPSPDRTLRIGYVSPDLRYHAVLRYIEPVLVHHDRRDVKIYCYAEVLGPDGATTRLQSLAHEWRWTCNLSDAELAQQIRHDGIDILVDLAGHSEGNRLGAFALKPAPIQATWLGYMNTTGLSSVDYRLTDELLDPPGQPVRDTEKLVRLSRGMCCFAPPVDAPAVSPMPAVQRGYLTFGSLNHLFKYNSRVFDAWSRILAALPTARLLIYRNTVTPTAQDFLRGEFAKRGIKSDQLDLRPGSGNPGYLRIYDEIDVSLDPFPCSGGVTTCESLWMGVPVLARCGERPASRNSAALLSRVGLSDWVVQTPEQYVAQAIRLANEIPRLAQLRLELRDQTANALCDTAAFTRSLEETYRALWRQWCGEQTKSSAISTISPPPQTAEDHARLATILHNQGELEDAVSQWQHVLRLAPNSAAAHNNLGHALVQLGRLNDAAHHCREAIGLMPDLPVAHNNLGNVLFAQHEIEAAADCYREALRLDPSFALASNNLGNALTQQGRLDEAVRCFQDSITARPDFAMAYNGLGTALRRAGRLDDGMVALRRAIELAPDDAMLKHNLGLALTELGKLAEAVACHDQALRLKPDFAEAHNGLAVALAQQGKYDAAMASLEQALRLEPGHADTHLNRAQLWLLLGKWAQGWPELEWRLQTKGWRCESLNKPRWDGSPLAGRTLLVLAEQGLGDTFQFVRYVQMIHKPGRGIIVRCQPPLKRLLANSLAGVQVISHTDPLPEFDAHIPLVSLPGILGTGLTSVPGNVPYLRADNHLVAYWREQLATLSGFKIGIAWQGSPTYPHDRQRSIPLEHFARLAQFPGVQLISLQKGTNSAQLSALSYRPTGFDETAGAFMDTAAILKNLDLVISSDTAVAHLAGALAVPVWVALPAVPDWRWMLERKDTPWYPTMRLFRQSRAGDWPEVFDRMRQNLASAGAQNDSY